MNDPESNNLSKVLPDKGKDAVLTDSVRTFSGWRGQVRVFFIFGAVQSLLALIINLASEQQLFYLQPLISLIFCFISSKISLRQKISPSAQAVSIILIIAAYALATGFFFITAIFVGGLPG